MIIEESRDQGCIPVLNELFEKYIDLPYYVLPVLASLQLIGIITGIILLIFLAQNEDLAQADSELDSEFDDDDRDAPMELPKPKLFCIIKQQKDNFGIALDYDEDRRGHIIKRISDGSNTEFAGVSLGSRVIEIAGLICCNASVGEINIRMEQCGNEMKMLVVEEDADLLYKEYKGTVISKI